MKKILFISTVNAHLYQLILEGFQAYSQTIQVDFMSNESRYKYKSKGQRVLNFLSKVFLRRNFKEVFHRKVMEKRMARLQPHYDMIFVIRPDLLTDTELQTLRQRTPKFVAYYWDTMQFFPRKKDIMPFFDKIYSFDTDDCKQYNLSLLTNFFFYEPAPAPIDKTVFSISHIEKKRFAMFNQMGKYLEEHHISYRFLTLQSKEKLKSPYIEPLKAFIPYREMLQLLNHYEVILDITKPHQHGLSFRIFESLGMNKKIITNNRAVMQYDFYHPDNMLVVDYDKLDLPRAFFTQPYHPISEEVKQQYHLKSFIKTILSNLD